MANNERLTAEKIRANYIEKEKTPLDELRLLDKRVKRPVDIFAYIYGSLSAVLMGAGMSLVMTEIGNIIGLGAASMPVGITLGVIGLILSISTYPIYKKLIGARRKKYSSKILEISDGVIASADGQ